MMGTVEQRAAELLRKLLAEQGRTVGELASRMGAEGVALRRMLTGEGGIQLDSLDGVLSALGVRPAEFFGRLYGPPEAPDQAPAAEPPAADPPAPSAEDSPISRREVEELLGELRSTIHGMVRLIDAERENAGGGRDGEE